MVFGDFLNMFKNIDFDAVKKALKILGLSEHETLTEAQLKHHYLKTMKRVHPDQGGNDYLSQQVNEARDILENWIKITRCSEHVNLTEQSYTHKKEDKGQEEDNKNNDNPKPTKNTESYKKTNSKAAYWYQQWVLFFIILGIICIAFTVNHIEPNLSKTASLNNENNFDLEQKLNASFNGELFKADSAPVLQEHLTENFLVKKPEVAIDPEQAIANSTGLLIRRKNKEGKELPVKGGYESDSKFIITFQGKEIFQDDKSAYVNFKSLFDLEGKKAILISFASGGNACGATYRLIVIHKMEATITDEFGNCAEPKISVQKDSIEFIFYDGFGKRIIITYNAGKLSEKNFIIPLHTDSENKDNGYEYLLKYVERDDIEGFLTEATVDKKLKKLMVNDYELFKDRLALHSAENIDGFIFLSGIAAHGGGSDEAYLAIALDGSHIYAGILETNFTKEREWFSTLKIFSDKPSMFSKLPAKMDEWMADHPKAKVVWEFKEN